MLKIKDIKSANCDNRPKGIEIDTIIYHYTGMRSHEEALSRLCDVNAKVSAHYMVLENGEIIRLVAEEMQAWHAGISCWNGKAALNENSIGIEIVNPGHEFGYKKFPQIQMDAVLALSLDILSRHKVPKRNIIGHSDVAPLRKKDPGELFDWRFLAENGVGTWPIVEGVRNPEKVLAVFGDDNDSVLNIQEKLSNYGYHLKKDGYYGEKTEDTIVAFKRHFIQDDMNAFWNSRAMATIDALLSLN